jgi:nucleoside phosphorylase
VILLVAATEGELTQLEGTRVLACGLGPVDAALATRDALAAERAQAVLHVGIAGARQAARIPLLSVVIGSESIYADHRLRSQPNPVAIPDAGLLAAARRALPGALVRPIATSGLVGGGRAADVEAMEGYGVLRAAQNAGVPAVEVRVVSNEVEEPDRARWMFADALATLHAIMPGLVEEVFTCTS